MDSEEINDFLWKRITKKLIHEEQDLTNYEGNLYHYTDLSGFKGIIDSNKFWGTDHLFLNDDQEIRYGTILVNELIDRLMISESKQNKKILEIIKERFNYPKYKEEIYIACFTELKDSLSQWKGFSNQGAGIAIGLSTSKLFKNDRKFPLRNIDIVKVIYNWEEQVDILEKEIQILIAYINEHQKYYSDLDSMGEACSTTALFCRRVICTFKSEVFAGEKEWRAIYRNIDKSEEGYQIVKYRIQGEKFIPYYEMDISPSAGKKNWSLPISEVIIGNVVGSERNLIAISRFISAHTSNEIKVHKSKISLQ